MLSQRKESSFGGSHRNRAREIAVTDFSHTFAKPSASQALGVLRRRDRNAGSTFPRVNLLSATGRWQFSWQKREFLNVIGISKERIGNALVPVAGRVFRARKTECGFSRGGSSSER